MSETVKNDVETYISSGERSSCVNWKNCKSSIY